jgi:hypothetical protein
MFLVSSPALGREASLILRVQFRIFYPILFDFLLSKNTQARILPSVVPATGPVTILFPTHAGSYTLRHDRVVIANTTLLKLPYLHIYKATPTVTGIYSQP